jgi:hypothetical protein
MKMGQPKLSEIPFFRLHNSRSDAFPNSHLHACPILVGLQLKIDLTSILLLSFICYINGDIFRNGEKKKEGLVNDSLCGFL